MGGPIGLEIDGIISSSGLSQIPPVALILTADPGTALSLTNTNTYTEKTIINSGILAVNSISMQSGFIAGDIEVISTNSTLDTEVDLATDTTSNLTLTQGATWTIGTGLNQQLNSLFVFGGGQVNNLTATLDLYASGPDIALTIDGALSNGTGERQSFVQLNTITLQNGGAITNGDFPTAFGVLDGTTVDLHGFQVPVLVNSEGEPTIGEPNLLFDQVTFTNSVTSSHASLLVNPNSLNDGNLFFSGHCSLPAPVDTSLPVLELENGFITIVGTLSSTGIFQIDLAGTVFVFSQFGGSSTYGGSGASLVNNGNLGIGFPAGAVISPVHFEVIGDYKQGSEAEIIFTAINTTAYSRLTVTTGSVMLDGAVIFEFFGDGTLSPGDQFLVIDNSAGTGVMGKFAEELFLLPENLNATIIYDPNQVFVLIGACGITPPPPPPPPSLTAYPNFSALTFADVVGHTIQLERRMQALRYRFAAPEDVCEGECFLIEEPLSVYIAPFGSIGDVHNHRDTIGYDFHSWGILGGIDYAMCNWGMGVQAGYEKFDGDVNRHWGDFDIQMAFGNAYATFVPFQCWSDLFLDLSLGAAGNWYDIHRKVDGDTAKGSPRGWQWDAFAGLGWDIKCNDWRFTPLAAVEYIHLHIGNYSEHGADDLDVHVEHQTFDSFRTWLGFSAGGEFCTCFATWLPEVRGYWLHEFAHQDHHINVTAPAFGSSAQIGILGEGRNFGTIGGELRALFCDQFTAAVSYDYYWNNTFHDNLLYGELAFNF